MAKSITIYRAELREINNFDLLDILKGQNIRERINECPECDGTQWWLLPKVSAAIRTGGKPYCECLNCGYQTHL